MTTTQEQFVDIAQRGQETLFKAVGDWVDTAREFATTVTAKAQSELPDSQDVVNQVFDFAEQVLRTQRELATNLVTAVRESGRDTTA
ncbi:MAG TPA: hypothetical protein VGD73_31725 [Pseudonocardia sp.]|jgi:hypothetical protein|uniref:hypothetical protein n=1 Tax=Pseudonocardia sp. TaxID=60912 RepID=UPI002ED9EF42